MSFEPASTVDDERCVPTVHTEARSILAGRYHLIALVGTGGSASVYRALDAELDDTVAVKVLHNKDATKEEVRALQREVKLARRVTHKHVARTFDIGEHDGERFLTMEYVDGTSLVSLLREGPTLLSRSLRIAQAIAEGLDAAHQAGVIHRDLKPANVLIESSGRIAITDFGVACSSARGPMAQRVPWAGTPVYMAPEQIDGQALLDARADLYALGEILFELLTAHRAWPVENTLEAAASRLVAAPPDLLVYRPDLPPAVGSLVKRLMARRREERPSGAAETLELLRTLHDVTTGAASTPSLGSVTRRSRSARGRELSVAVLPLRTDSAVLDHVADGFTSDLLDTLSASHDLRVCPLSIVKRYKDSRLDARQMGRELSVAAVVHGSVAPAEDGSFRLALGVASVEDGYELWTATFTARTDRLFSTCDEAASAIGEALATKVARRTRTAMCDPQAVDLYLRARQELGRKAYGSDVLEAVALLEQALTRAPDEPHILAAYAVARSRISHTPEASLAALASAERATLLAPHLAEAWLALASVRFMRAEFVPMIHACGEALTLAPHLAKAHHLLSDVMYQVGWVDGAVRASSLALALDPSLQGPAITLAVIHELLGDHERADVLLDDPSLQRQPVRSIAAGTRRRMAMWQRKRVQHEPPEEIEGPAHVFVAFFHDVTATQRVSGELVARVRSFRSLSSTLVASFVGQIEAEAWAFVGQSDRALDAIEFADSRGLIDLLWMDRMPLFSEIRVLSRFKELRERVERRARVLHRALTEQGFSD